MIPRAHIIEWRSVAPWISDAQVEQDLIISRGLLALFSSPELKDALAFRGGTALHKIYLKPATRYSEDIDLVQIAPAPAGPIIDSVRLALDLFLGAPHVKQTHRSITLTYRFESEIPPIQPLKLKVEINTREHFSLYGFAEAPFEVQSQWHSGQCSIKTYELSELLGTKLRAMYQRRKGRDLYDLWLGLTRGGADPGRIAAAFRKYMDEEGGRISPKDYRENLSAKMARADFLGDTNGLLRPEVRYDPLEAYALIEERILPLLE